jgi:urease accessory protein
LIFATLFALPAAAASHVVASGGFASGFSHPLLGLDHLIAMVAVGLLSVQIGGRAIWTVPASFVVVIGLGGALGLAGIPLPQVEGAIALSVFALGLAIAAERAWPTWLAMIFVAFFAVFHGHAHGAEIPSLASPLAYVAGFMLATAFLHLVGVGIGEACRLARSPQRLRALIGAGIAGIGLHILLLTYEIV